MRVIGPLTCVMACVVWSLSQSTVPVVRTEAVHAARVTVASCRCASCAVGTVKYVGVVAVVVAGVDAVADEEPPEGGASAGVGVEPHAARHMAETSASMGALMG